MKYSLTLASALFLGLAGLTGCPAEEDHGAECETDADCADGEHCHMEGDEGHCEADEGA